MTADENTTHALYRFFDAGGDLLYVGITNDPSRRWGRHANDKPWWSEVDLIELDRHPSRAAVLEAERRAILAEKPRYNVRHVPRPEPRPSPGAPDRSTIVQCSCCKTDATVLVVKHTDIAAYRQAYKDWDAEIVARSPHGVRVIRGSMLFSQPDVAAWTAYCDDHIDESGNPYGIRVPTTWRAWVHHTAHLMGKNWFVDTNWSSWLQTIDAGFETGQWSSDASCSHEVPTR